MLSCDTPVRSMVPVVILDFRDSEKHRYLFLVPLIL
jgi:hypothetical protein